MKIVCLVVVCGLVIVSLSTASGFAIKPQAVDASNQKNDVTARRLRRDVRSGSDNLEADRNMNDIAVSGRESENDQIKKLSTRLNPYLDRYVFFPFDDYDYRNEYPMFRELAARRVKSLAAANELRRTAADRNNDDGDDFWLTNPDPSRHRHQDGGRPRGLEPSQGFDERDERNQLPQETDRRQQRSFDSLGGGLLPIKKQFDSLGGGLLPIKREPSSSISENHERTVTGEDLERRLNQVNKQFDSRGGGVVQIKVKGQSRIGADERGERSRGEFDVRRRNFDSLGGGLLPI